MICVNRNGLIDTLIKLAKWSPFGICNTSSGDLLVCLRTDIGHQGKVVRLSGSNVTQEIQYDTEGKPLLSKKASGLFVAENKNSDVCVSDPGGEAVIVVNKSGNLRFRFRGQEMFECFTPYGIVTDTMSQILVADRDNDSIHIIDCDGKFLRFIKGSGLHQPFSLSITKNNLLFVSSGTEDKISIVQYTD
ncbi:tripartite motif-containing protein 2-like [Saccostrea cucullata]